MEWDTVSVEVVAKYRRGEFQDALDLIDDAWPLLPQDRDALAWFRACLLAVQGRNSEAVTVLDSATAAGAWYCSEMLNEADLDSVRHSPRFSELVEIWARREADFVRPAATILNGSAASEDRVLVALHRSESSPARSLNHWAAGASDWTLVMPWATHPRGSASAMWLEAIGAEIDWTAAEAALDADISGLSPAREIRWAGFAQGAAVALDRVLSQGGRVLLVGATHRYLDVAARHHSVERDVDITAWIGEHERHVEPTQNALDQLRARGARTSLTVTSGLAHVFPEDFDARLREWLAGNTSPGENP